MNKLRDKQAPQVSTVAPRPSAKRAPRSPQMARPAACRLLGLTPHNAFDACNGGPPSCQPARSDTE